ncbi:MAG TPA: DnaJ C-terminal domain-containing protein [Parvibaculum sp.]
MRDPYTILGLAPGAGAAEIKAAYRRLAKQHHPDAQGKAHADPREQARFQEVTAAYNLLKDDAARTRFDASTRAAAAGGDAFTEAPFARGAQGAGAHDDIFSDIFGGIRSAGKRVFRARGDDQTYRLSVPFLEAAQGTKRRVTLASGKTLDVRIPAGIEDGQQIRLRGQGGEGHGGAAAGDALIVVAVEAHERFRRDGLDIHLTVPVSLPEAVLGARIEVETVSGPVAVSVPAGASTGLLLRLKGKGISPEGGAEAGDQYVRLEVVLPAEPDAALRDFVAGWTQGRMHNPRRET